MRSYADLTLNKNFPGCEVVTEESLKNVLKDSGDTKSLNIEIHGIKVVRGKGVVIKWCYEETKKDKKFTHSVTLISDKPLQAQLKGIVDDEDSNSEDFYPVVANCRITGKDNLQLS